MARTPCRTFAKQARIFVQQKYGSERCMDVPRTTTAWICSCKSRVEKPLRRFSFIRDAHNSCAGNFALRARCKLRTARNRSGKSRVEKPLRRFSFIEYAKKSCALLGIALVSRELKNAWRVFLLSIRSRFLRTARNRSLLHKLSSAFIILYNI